MDVPPVKSVIFPGQETRFVRITIIDHEFGCSSFFLFLFFFCPADDAFLGLLPPTDSRAPCPVLQGWPGHGCFRGA
jgi:hypothetical protein